jgi:hypothetical protein
MKRVVALRRKTQMRRTPVRMTQGPADFKEEKPMAASTLNYSQGDVGELRAAAVPHIGLRRGVMAKVDEVVRAVPKEEPLRCEKYLRLVAALPCKCCGRMGRSQAAHLPPIGKSTKQDDRLTFPLCADELGALGCHSKYDRYILFPREQAMRQGERWAADTRAQIRMAGAWPKNLPHFN